MDDEADDQIGKSKEYWVGATAYTPKTTMLLTEPKNLKKGLLIGVEECLVRKMELRTRPTTPLSFKMHVKYLYNIMKNIVFCLTNIPHYGII